MEKSYKGQSQKQKAQREWRFDLMRLANAKLILDYTIKDYGYYLEKDLSLLFAELKELIDQRAERRGVRVKG